ncbi:MAG: VanZ family protein [Clostridia bacterium]|nr:VanZ family protein [Clostridia bacterium]MBO7155978.1 VanZ family protein [Clostridia bacterium]
MKNNRDNKTSEKLKTVKIEISNSSLRDEKMFKGLVAVASVSITLLLVWALVFKCGSTIMLERNYHNLRQFTTVERIMWDIIPFNYRHEGVWHVREVLETVLNCFVFAPLSFTLCFFFKRGKCIKAAAVAYLIAICIEISQIFTAWANPATEDLITNLAGAIIGSLIYLLLFRRPYTKKTARLWIVINVLLCALVVFATVTMVIAGELILSMMRGTL